MMRRAAIFGGLALALGSGFATWRSRRNDRLAEETHPPLGDFVEVDGVRVHYLKTGDGPPVVLLHGAGGNLRDYTLELVDRLAQDYTVIAFDRPGHGYTGTIHNRGESPAEQAALLAKALDKIGVEQAVIGGFSYGGSVALAWALNHPDSVSGLLLMNSVSNPWVLPPSKLYDLAAGRVTGPIFTTSVSAFAPKGLVQDTLASIFNPKPTPEGYLDHIGVGLSLRRSQLMANGRQVSTLLPHIREQSARYGELTLPIEIIVGEEDVSVPPHVHADVLITQVPHATYTRVPGVGHSTHHYAQDEIVAALARLTAAA